MIRFAFKKGLCFLHKTHKYTLVRQLASGKYQLEDESGEFISLTEQDLYKNWRTGQWQIDEESVSLTGNVFYFASPKDLRSYPKVDQQEVQRRLHYLEQVKKQFDRESHKPVSTRTMLAPKIQAIADELGDSAPPSPDTLWRWWKRFTTTKCVTKLIKKNNHSGRKTDPVQRSLFEEAVCEVYLTPQKKPGLAVVEAVHEKAKRLNAGVPEADRIKPASPATIYRWLNSLNFALVKTSREGKAATEKELRSVVSGVTVDKILERVEIDHTPLDILVICELTRLILGRPWLTLALDRRSRMIVGFYISFHAPSATSVLNCLRMSIMPKDEILAAVEDVTGPWPARGVPDSLTVDNGMDLHADAVDDACLELGIEIQYCGVAKPEMKGAIERAIGTVNRSLIHTLPGTTFSNVKQRGSYDSEKHAALDIKVLTQVLVKWIVDVYHKTPHRGLAGRTPLDVWQENEVKRIIELPAYPRQLEMIVGHMATRKLFHYGLEYGNLQYNSPQLQTIRQRLGGSPKLQLRAFDHDVGYIAVFDPSLDGFIDVPAIKIDYAQGLNRHVHLLVCAETRSRFGDQWTYEQLREVKSEIQAIVDAAIREKKTGTRKAAAVARMTDSEQVLATFANRALINACDRRSAEIKPLEPLDPGVDDQLPEFFSSVRNVGDAA